MATPPSQTSSPPDCWIPTTRRRRITRGARQKARPVGEYADSPVTGATHSSKIARNIRVDTGRGRTTQRVHDSPPPQRRPRPAQRPPPRPPPRPYLLDRGGHQKPPPSARSAQASHW